MDYRWLQISVGVTCVFIAMYSMTSLLRRVVLRVFHSTFRLPEKIGDDIVEF